MSWHVHCELMVREMTANLDAAYQALGAAWAEREYSMRIYQPIANWGATLR